MNSVLRNATAAKVQQDLFQHDKDPRKASRLLQKLVSAGINKKEKL